MTNRPKTVAEFMRRAREAGHDAFGIANDPEALAVLDALYRARDHGPFAFKVKNCFGSG